MKNIILVVLFTFFVFGLMSNANVDAEAIENIEKIRCVLSESGKLRIMTGVKEFTIAVDDEPKSQCSCNLHKINNRSFILVRYETPVWGTTSAVKSDVIEIYEIVLKRVFNELICSWKPDENRPSSELHEVSLKSDGKNIFAIIKNLKDKEDITLFYIYDHDKEYFILKNDD